MVGALNLIGVLCCNRANVRILVIQDTGRNPGLGNYLAQYGSHVTVIEPNSRLLVFTQRLEQIMHGKEPSTQQVGSRAGEGYPNSLSVQELLILETLLTGKRARQVTCQLSLDEKAFSYYKRRALTKLGIKNIHLLLSRRSPVSLL
ncbi:LuxR C-terminal-related transcriptional regulator (plasmid) [Serratia sp. L9]|uniref:LuxR C-terminal-related transcriptional regulator n=1 Tax=Serratia sp. L9 TaxID=3423946 RepID=UPI003D6705AE